jgi:hypothetical protein
MEQAGGARPQLDVTKIKAPRPRTLEPQITVRGSSCCNGLLPPPSAKTNSPWVCGDMYGSPQAFTQTGREQQAAAIEKRKRQQARAERRKQQASPTPQLPVMSREESFARLTAPKASPSPTEAAAAAAAAQTSLAQASDIEVAARVSMRQSAQEASNYRALYTKAKAELGLREQAMIELSNELAESKETQAQTESALQLSRREALSMQGRLHEREAEVDHWRGMARSAGEEVRSQLDTKAKDLSYQNFEQEAQLHKLRAERGTLKRRVQVGDH